MLSIRVLVLSGDVVVFELVLRELLELLLAGALHGSKLLYYCRILCESVCLNDQAQGARLSQTMIQAQLEIVFEEEI